MVTQNTKVPIQVSREGRDWRGLVDQWLAQDYPLGPSEDWYFSQAHSEYLDYTRDAEVVTTIKPRTDSEQAKHEGVRNVRTTLSVDVEAFRVYAVCTQTCGRHADTGCGREGVLPIHKIRTEQITLYEMTNLCKFLNQEGEGIINQRFTVGEISWD